MKCAASDAAAAARDALDAAAAATEEAVRSLDAALRAELQSVAGELRSGQAAICRRLDAAEDAVAQAAPSSQVRCPHACCCHLLLRTGPVISVGGVTAISNDLGRLTVT